MPQSRTNKLPDPGSGPIAALHTLVLPPDFWMPTIPSPLPNLPSPRSAGTPVASGIGRHNCWGACRPYTNSKPAAMARSPSLTRWMGSADPCSQARSIASAQDVKDPRPRPCRPGSPSFPPVSTGSESTARPVPTPDRKTQAASVFPASPTGTGCSSRLPPTGWPQSSSTPGLPTRRLARWFF